MNIFSFPFHKFIIHGSSMSPTFLAGDRILVTQWFFSLKVGDIVVIINVLDKPLVKRIQSIDNGMYSVIGDNKDESTDSRIFGSLKRENIFGKFLLKL